LDYLIRVDRVGRELVLYYRAETEDWREAVRKLLGTAQEARREAIRLEHAEPESIVTSFEKWGCSLPEALRAPGARIRRC
jgi:hypothetical protein